VPEGLGDVFGLDADKADVAGLDNEVIVAGGIVYLDFKAVKSQKLVVVKLIMGNKYIVIGKSYRGIAELLIESLNLFGRSLTV
jgi:hypothetical protein